MIKLKISFSKEKEIERVIYTMDKIDWFNENGYRPILPLEINKDFFLSKGKEGVTDAVEKEFSVDDYEKTKTYIENNQSDILPKLYEFVKKIGFTPQEEYIIVLTKYGVAGSYHVPNTIVINIKMKYEKGLMRTIVHEILHLTIENLIKEYKISHWKKERVIDLLLNECVPDYVRFQNIPEDTQKLDGIFRREFPNVQLIL